MQVTDSTPETSVRRSLSEATLLVVGAGGFAREAATIAQESNIFSSVALIADRAELVGKLIQGFMVLGVDLDLRALRAEGYRQAFVAVGDPRVRARLTETCANYGFAFPTVVHSTSYVSPDVTVGEGSILYPHSTVMAGCSLGRGCLVNANASLGHECEIGNYVDINPGANIAGRVTVGDHAFIGIGAVILQNRRIGAGAIVGGGAVVTRDVEAGSTVIGVPARPRA